MKTVEQYERASRGSINVARSPCYALLAELRLRAIEATWAVRGAGSPGQPPFTPHRVSLRDERREGKGRGTTDRNARLTHHKEHVTATDASIEAWRARCTLLKARSRETRGPKGVAKMTKWIRKHGVAWLGALSLVGAPALLMSACEQGGQPGGEGAQSGEQQAQTGNTQGISPEQGQTEGSTVTGETQQGDMYSQAGETQPGGETQLGGETQPGGEEQASGTQAGGTQAGGAQAGGSQAGGSAGSTTG